ncbi:class I SAM-dependent methyltransferase [Clostridioides difficile]|nr:class I SAM-dependent methyltransferase [Clostridioides difficile]
MCLDAVIYMLQTGKQGADKKYLVNMFFVKGYVEELLFLDNSYDIVFSCIVFHHCTNVQNIFCIFRKW